MVEVSHLHFDRDFKNVFQQILNRECVKKKAGKTVVEEETASKGRMPWGAATTMPTTLEGSGSGSCIPWGKGASHRRPEGPSPIKEPITATIRTATGFRRFAMGEAIPKRGSSYRQERT